ncbi:hypothetical protein P4560_18760, partial [Heyndrickxia sporothermodurans]|uniref:hypothetical protein n=1 Tax=Heyndrickxia sporothermodurans TaxID=46224 RepID=UPI002E236CC8|nr:hypothetical protein [Heyndrickxia sporothermodurans]
VKTSEWAHSLYLRKAFFILGTLIFYGDIWRLLLLEPHRISHKKTEGLPGKVPEKPSDWEH